MKYPTRFLLCLSLALCMQATAQAVPARATGPLQTDAPLSFGTAESINRDWLFTLGEKPGAQEPKFDDHEWQQIDLPHDWSVKLPLSPELASCTGYLPGGIGWYRKKISIPSRPDGEKVYLYFEGVYNRSTVYLNGHLLGQRPNGYVSFYYDATPYVKFDQDNVLAVRVDHSRSADSRWYTGSGIYRDVYLVRANAVHLAPWSVFVQAHEIDASAKSAQLSIVAQIQNDTKQEATLDIVHELLAADGTVVATVSAKITVPAAETRGSTAAVKLNAPHLWSLDDPYLYQLRTTVSQGDQQLDQTVTRTGVRALAFDPNTGFSLNGIATKVKGVCIHHDAGVLGAAVPAIVWKKRLQTLKSIGCNAVRLSHNPQAPIVYDLCDELGLLVMDEAFDEWEFPKRKWLRGWNVGEPGFEGATDFFEAWSDRDLTDMVRRDRNHPSIFAWSIGNEIDYPNDPYSHPVLDRARINQPMLPGYKPDHPDAKRLGVIAKRLAADVRKMDTSRPVTAALAGVVMSNETEYPGALDIVGYNYTEDRYAMDHEKYPKRVIYGSENGHSLKAWRAVQDNAFIFGQFLWTGIDYLGEARPWPARGSTSGLLDLTGAVKPQGRFREALWSNKPVIYLGTDAAPTHERRPMGAWPIWNYAAGEAVRAVCYTNAASVRLMLNGKRVGEDKSYDKEDGALDWELPFEPGELTAIALDAQGNEIGRATLRSAAAPVAFQLTTEEHEIARDGGVSMIALQLTDQHGVPVLTADRDVTCAITGPARLLGLEASNNRDVSDYTDSVQSTYHGRLVAYIQATAVGDVQLRFSAKDIADATTTLKVRD
ncbi:MAG TPA: glycoside hydrolase family 2 TIM barrel-domain containing protein [Opitutaceae bacterium]|nr:glycoside hydrolase family 2 TIM barrel-domain containing protein [Opitutaceae bacterium]